ncbi:MAG: helix-turn-helix domain-containing protein [Bacilli bacterium]|nr:helix-turn-helix domain-containing protein [Bacilli bacterium]
MSDIYKRDYFQENADKFEEYKILLEYKKRLNEKELFVFENFLTRHHVVPYSMGFNQFDYQKMCDLWIEVRFSNTRILTIKEYTAKELGKLIKDAREYDGRTRIEVAEIIGISPNTLKMCEEGKRMIPADVFLSLNQLYGDIIELNKAFPKDPLLR